MSNDSMKPNEELIHIINTLRKEYSELKKELDAARRELKRFKQHLSSDDLLLVAKNKFIEKTIESNGAIIVGFDKNYVIKIFNRAAEKVTGYKKEEVIGNNWFDVFYAGELKEKMNKAWSKAWNQNQQTTIIPLTTKKNEIKTLTWHLFPFYDKNNNNNLLISIGTDITDREHAIELLHHNKLLMRHLFSVMKDVVLEIDYNGKILYVAPTSAELIYTPPEALLGKTLHETFSKEQADQFLQFIRSCISKNRTDTLIYPLEINNKTYWFEGRAYPISENRVFFIATDITIRKSAEDAAKQRDNYLSALNRANDILFDGGNEINYSEFVKIVGTVSNASRTYIFKNHTDKKGKLLLSQIAEYVAGGIKPEIDNPQLQNMPYDDFIPRWKKILSEGNMIAGKVSGFPENERAILEPQEIKSILVMPIFIDNDFWGFIGFDNCMNDREWSQHEIEYLKAAKEKLELKIIYSRDKQLLIEAKTNAETSEAKFKGIIEQTAEGITMVDLKGRYTLVNHSFCNMTGYTKKELLKMKVTDLVAHSEKIKMEPEQFGIPLNYYLKRKDNTVFPVRVIVNPIKIGSANYLLGMVTDITKQKEYEYQLIKAKERAEQSDRLKSAFLANMSHEIRTPMNGILGFTSLLKEPDLSGDDMLEYIQIIEKSGQRLLNTINDIIDMSRIESGLVEVVNSAISINDILNEQYVFFQPEAQKKGLQLSVSTPLSNEESKIYTDRHKLESVLINLIKNAIKFTQKGEIKFGYTLKAEKNKQMIEFFVKDTGIGIPHDRIHAVFNRFEQADIEDTRAYEGSGLGLAISKSYIEMLGGKISVASEVNKGSVFTLTIPYVTVPMNKNTQSDDGTGNITWDFFNNITAIIAEDDSASRYYMQQLFNNKFKKVIYTDTGKDTVTACRENPDIDLILMDIKMPDMSGYQATREIRKFNKKVVIIAQTAYGMSDDRKKALNAGCNDYISKPIKKHLLFNKILTHFKNMKNR